MYTLQRQFSHKISRIEHQKTCCHTQAHSHIERHKKHLQHAIIIPQSPIDPNFLTNENGRHPKIARKAQVYHYWDKLIVRGPCYGL